MHIPTEQDNPGCASQIGWGCQCLAQEPNAIRWMFPLGSGSTFIEPHKTRGGGSARP